MKKINRRDVDWRDKGRHKQFIIDVFTKIIAIFQLLCFLYVAVNAIIMANNGQTDKCIEWSLVALIIKPYGDKIKD